MTNVLELFDQKTMLDYVNNRQYQTYAAGEALFPEQKYPTLDFKYIVGSNDLPVIASVHSFDTEAEIGSVEAQSQALQAAYIKKKYQINEDLLIKLAFPRNDQEKNMLVNRVFNLTDKAVNDVRARVEYMRMQALAKGKLELDLAHTNDGTGKKATVTVDYNVPANHKEVLTSTAIWGLPTADILGDIERWSRALDVAPTRALTSRKIVSLMLRDSKIIGYLYGANSARVANLNDLNAFMAQQGLPQIAVYESTNNTKYRVQKADGTYETKSYFPEESFVMFGDGPLGETLYGPTPEESRLIRDGAEVGNVGNIITMLFEEGQDPISTWTKAATTAIPSFPQANNVFQAQPIAAV